MITNAVSHLSTPDRRYWANPPARIPPRVSTPDPPADSSLPPVKRARGPTKRRAEVTNQQLGSQAAHLTTKEREHRRDEDRCQQEESEETFNREHYRDQIQHLHGE
jgi:hypothetical protein